MKFTQMEKRAINLMREWGKLERYDGQRGNIWGQPGFKDADRPFAMYVGNPTIRNLYDRRLIDVICTNGSWQWEGNNIPRFAVPTQELIHNHKES